MQTSTPSIVPSATSGSTNSAQPAPAKPVTLNWTLQRLNRTWFVSPLDGAVLRLEKKAPDGANDEHWRALIRTTGIRIENDDPSKPWGPQARRDFLNWLENEHSERMAALETLLFDSPDAASKPTNRTEKSEDTGESSNDIEPKDAPEKLPTVIALLRQKPEATDEDVRQALSLRTPGVARMWKVLAQERLESEKKRGGNH